MAEKLVQCATISVPINMKQTTIKISNFPEETGSWGVLIQKECLEPCYFLINITDKEIVKK